MRTFDSPINTSHINHPVKYKNNESPISKLTVLSDVRNTYQHSRIDNALNDRSNEVFFPKNASKFIEESYEKKINREKQIEEIRKKYYEQTDQKKNNRAVSQNYQRYEAYRQKELRTEKRDQKYREINQTLKKQASRPKESQTTNTANQMAPSSIYSRQVAEKFKNQQKSILEKQNSRPTLSELQKKVLKTSNLDRISEASNSNYETVNKTLETFSPEKNRGKSSLVMDDKSVKKNQKNYNAYHFVESFKTKDNNQSIIKETSSVYDESAKNSTGKGKASQLTPYHGANFDKSSKVEAKFSKVQAYNMKPFSIEESGTLRETPRDILAPPSSRQSYNNRPLSIYPTAYENLMSRKVNPSTTQKSRVDDEVFSRPRTLTEHKRNPSQKVRQTGELSQIQIQKDTKRRALDFGDHERIKEIEKRLKQRQMFLKKNQQNFRNRRETQQERRTEQLQNRNQLYQKVSEKVSENYHLNRTTYQEKPQEKSNVDKEIQKLSYKIKQFEDRKKQLNIPNMKTEEPTPSKPFEKQTQKKLQPKDFQDARKALQEYRQGARAKSSMQVYEIHDYKIPSEVSIQESKISSGNQQDSILTHRQFVEMSKEPSRRCEFLQNTKPMYSQRTLPVTARREDSSRFGFQLYKIQNEDSEQSLTCRSKITTISSSSKNANDCRTQFQMHRRTDNGIQQRKKRLQQNKKTGPTQEMKRLVSALSQQSIHDEEFRNCKIWFENQRDQNKWKELKNILSDYNQQNIKLTELKDGKIAEFLICEDENNPFFSVNQGSKFTYHALVKAFLNSRKFWEENIVKKFDGASLKSEGFTLQKFDLQRKGYINLEDFVRFLNFQSGNFYRNRDLVLIYKRFLNERASKEEKALTIEKILSTLVG